MDRKAVNSSNIQSVGYDPNRKVLEVEFKNGGVYQYDGVPQDMADAFVGAESLGRFLQTRIKPAFPARRMGA